MVRKMKLIIFFFQITGKFYAYKPVMLGDGTHSISKCQTPLASHPRTDVTSDMADLAIVFDAIGKIVPWRRGYFSSIFFQFFCSF